MRGILALQEQTELTTKSLVAVSWRRGESHKWMLHIVDGILTKAYRCQQVPDTGEATMPDIVKQLHGSAQEYRAASRAALGRASRLHGLQMHQQRIAALIGQPRTAAAP